MKLALLSSLLLAGITVNAQTAIMSDINPAGSSNPSWLTDYSGKRILFFADNGVNGSELHVYDTASTIVYDLNPGMAPGTTMTNYRKMARIGNTVYFPGDDGTTGLELYKWAGDSTAPMLVSDIRTGSTGSNITELQICNDKVYFAANNGTNGGELWCYDPATGITQRLTDLIAGGGSSDPRELTVYKNKLYFVAAGTGFGIELFVYDPVNNTTANALDIIAGTGGSNPSGMTVINDKMYFTASTIAYGRELYSYDAKNVSRLTDVDNASSDGVTSIPTGSRGIVGYKSMILFAGSNGVSNSQLFQYNPMNGVTSMVYTINPLGNAFITNFTVYAGKLYFSADNGSQGSELWVYDGTVPMMITDLEPGFDGSSPTNMLGYGTKLFFSAFTSLKGNELYILSDSAALGVKSINFNAEVKVYPNPAKAITHIAMDLNNAATLSVAVTDITGKIVYKLDAKQYAAGSHTVDVAMENMALGMYVYTLRDQTGKMMASGRIEKQ